MDAPLTLVLIGDGPLTTAYLEHFTHLQAQNGAKADPAPCPDSPTLSSPAFHIAVLVARKDEHLKAARELGALALQNVQDASAALPEPDAVLITDESGEPGGYKLCDPALARETFGPSTNILDEEAGRFLLKFLAVHDPTCKWEPLASPQLFSSLLDQLREDILLLDTRGMLLDCNANLVARKRRPKNELIGHHFTEILDEDENLCKSPETPCPFATALATGAKAEAMYSRVDAEGRVRYLRVYAYPLYGPDGRVAFVAEIRRDITRRTKMELRLQQSEKLAAVGELSTYLAHEIRNPLFVISGFANSLSRAKDITEPAREKITAILEESRRLDDILKALINFARPMESAAGEVDLAHVVNETMLAMRFALDREDLRVHMDLQSGLPKAKGDADLLKQCLINLVKNAVEAMPAGGELTIRVSQDLSHLTLSVADTGPGIPEEDRAKVFSPFFSTKDKGAGLGLAMIKKMVEDMGGDVVLHSITGQGTTVTLRLSPALAEADTAASMQNSVQNLEEL